MEVTLRTLAEVLRSLSNSILSLYRIISSNDVDEIYDILSGQGTDGDNANS